jgi:hypothetical protein
VIDEAIALAFETGLPFVGLRDHEHDPELDNVVPVDAARFARAIPLTAGDDHVRLAVADPEPDLAALSPYIGDRRVELAIAPRAELEEILGPPPPAPPAPAGEELAVAEPPAVADEHAEAEAEAEPPAAAAPLAAAEPDLLIAEPEPEAGSEEEAAPLAAAEPHAEPEAEAEPLAAEPHAEPEPEPEPLAAAEPQAEPEAPAEPQPDAAAAPHAFTPAFPAEEAPSWLEPPRKRRWLRAIGIFLLYVLVLAVVCGAVAAYLLTR